MYYGIVNISQTNIHAISKSINIHLCYLKVNQHIFAHWSTRNKHLATGKKYSFAPLSQLIHLHQRPFNISMTYIFVTLEGNKCAFAQSKKSINVLVFEHCQLIKVTQLCFSKSSKWALSPSEQSWNSHLHAVSLL